MVEFEFLIFDTLLGTKKPQTKQKLNTHSHFCMLKRMRIENQNGLIVIIIRSTSQSHWTIALMLVGDTRASSLISFVMLHQSVFFSPSVRFIQAYCDLIGYFTIIIPLRNHSKLVGCFCCYYYGLWRTKSALATGFACLRSVFDRLKVKRKQSSKMKMRKNTNVNYIAPFPVRWKTIAVKIFVDIFFVLCVCMWYGSMVWFSYAMHLKEMQQILKRNWIWCSRKHSMLWNHIKRCLGLVRASACIG